MPSRTDPHRHPAVIDFTSGRLSHALLGSAMTQKLSLTVQIASELVAITLIAAQSQEVLAVVGYLAGFTAFSYAIAFALGDVFALLLAPVVGAGQREAAMRLLWRALAVSLAMALVIAIGAWGLMGQAATVLSVPAELQSVFAPVYLYFCLGFVLKILLFAAFGSLRAFGRVRAFSSLNMAVALAQPALVLGGLALVQRPDPVQAAHIFGLAYCLPLTLGLLVVLLGARRLPVSRHHTGWRADLRAFFRLAPAVVAIALLSPLIVAVTAYLLAQTGPEIVAAFGIISKLQPLLFVGMLAWLSTLSVALGQNLGAGAQARSVASYRLSCAYVLAWQVALALPVIAFADSIAGFFIKEGPGQAFLGLFCLIVPIGYGAWAVASMATKVFNLVQSPFLAVTASVVRNLGLVLPCLVIGYALAGAEGVLWGLTIGNVVAGAILYPLALKRLKRHLCVP